MMRLPSMLLAAAVALPLAPAAADVGAPGPSVQRSSSPTVLSETERANYREIFALIRAADWTAATAKLDAMGDGPLHALARAEL